MLFGASRQVCVRACVCVLLVQRSVRSVADRRVSHVRPCRLHAWFVHGVVVWWSVVVTRCGWRSDESRVV